MDIDFFFFASPWLHPIGFERIGYLGRSHHRRHLSKNFPQVQAKSGWHKLHLTSNMLEDKKLCLALMHE